jgi:hypothetical protein
MEDKADTKENNEFLELLFDKIDSERYLKALKFIIKTQNKKDDL